MEAGALCDAIGIMSFHELRTLRKNGRIRRFSGGNLDENGLSRNSYANCEKHDVLQSQMRSCITGKKWN